MKREALLKKHPYKIWGKDGKWYTYLPDEKKGRILKKKTTKKAIEDDVIEYLKEELENPTIRDVFIDWIYKKAEMGEIGSPTYERYKIDFARYFGDFGEKKIKSITEDEIEDFLTDCVVKFYLTTKGFSNLKIIVRGIFKRAKKKKYVQFGITELINNMEISRKIFKQNKKSDAREVFNDEEFEKIEKYLVQNMDLVNLGVLLTFFTGIRVNNPFGEYMFSKNGDRIKTYSFRKRLYHICDSIGVPRKSPHKIRKTYASILLDNHISEKFITDLMGHTDIQCTNQFYGRNRKTNAEKAESL